MTLPGVTNQKMQEIGFVRGFVISDVDLAGRYTHTPAVYLGPCQPLNSDSLVVVISAALL